MYKNIMLLLSTLGLAFVLSACVTINIYFPAAAAEKAADKIIEEVWQLEDAKTKPEKTPESPLETLPEAKPTNKPSDVPAK